MARPSPRVRARRVYEEPGADDGARVLIDRLWPRGLSKARAGVDLWLREIAPSDGLRRWYRHDPELWPEFRRRYRAELAATPEPLERLTALARSGPLTLVFSSREVRLNNAAVLVELLRSRLRRRAARHG